MAKRSVLLYTILNCTSRRHDYTLAVLHSFKKLRVPASTGQSGVKVVQAPRELEPLARLPTPHYTHSRPVCNIFKTVYMR